MTRVWFLAALSLSSLAYGAEKKPSVGVFMDFDAKPANIAVDAMKREVDEIMRPAGLRVDWRQVGENRGAEAFTGVVVVKFKGKCQVQPWLGESFETELTSDKVVLGTSLVSNGQVLPFSEIECDQVRKLLAYQERSTEMDRQCALGRAMGRVVAHELYHVLACTTKHAGHGLAKATQTLRTMVRSGLGFNNEEAAAIRQGLTRRGLVFSVR
jgi:hypothetical protein